MASDALRGEAVPSTQRTVPYELLPGGSVHGERATSQGSLSAVSKPNFARKYALEISHRDLHNALFCTVLKYQFFSLKSRHFLIFFSIFAVFSIFLLDVAQNLPEFYDFFRKFQIDKTCSRNCTTL